MRSFSFQKFRVVLFLATCLVSGFASCRKNSPRREKNPTIIRLEVKHMPFAGAPTFFAPAGWFETFLKQASADSQVRIALGQDSETFDRPLSLELNWSLRPATRIRPIVQDGKTLDHAVELSVQSTLVPLYPHDPNEVHTSVASRWITYAQTDVKHFDERLKAELQEAFSETLSALWMESELLEMPVGQIIRQLASANPHIRKAAVEAVKKRELVEAVPALIELMETEKGISTRLTIVGVLGHLKDPSAVETLAEFALLILPEQAVYVCSEIAKLGGDQARTFLHWVSSAHGHPEVRRAAANMLRTMLLEKPLHQNPP